uniref:AN1-type domain-containing protein n=1 Tax=Trichobilharzia regenti TaxID=157069 RepID=A0AA85JS30_TRIRE|nr:unnamed protein product [Trichobilharzia regenti]
MTELNIGANCSQEDCKRLDFLPINFELCSRIFCMTHSSLTAHNCPISNPSYPEESISHRQYHDTDNGEDNTVIHKQKEVHECPFLESNQKDKGQSAKAVVVDRAALNAISHTPIGNKPKESTTTKPLSDRARAAKAKLILLRAEMEALPGGKHPRDILE